MNPTRRRGVARALASGIFACGSGLLACGGGSPAPPTPAPPVAILPLATDGGASTSKAALSDLPPPEDLTFLVRANDPEQLFREVGSLVPTAGAILATTDLPKLAALGLGPKIADVIDFGAPVDIANLGARDRAFVFSFAVKPDAEPTLAKKLDLRSEGPLSFVTRRDDRGGGLASACAITASVGRSSTRLVCGESEDVVRRTARWFALRLAGEANDADARMTVPGAFLRENTGRGGHTLGDATSKLGAETVSSFFDEVGTMDAALRFHPARIDAELTLHMTKRASLLGRVLATRATAGPAPAAFFRLPADSLVAVHTRGALAEDLRPLRTAFSDDLERTLVADGYRNEDVRGMVQGLEAIFLTGGPLVVAAGVAGGTDKTMKALASVASLSTGDPAKARALPKAEAEARAALVPWLLFEVEEAPDRFIGAARELVKRAEDAEKTRKPGSKASKPRDPDGDHVDVKLVKLDPKLGLPAGSQAFDFISTPRSKKSVSGAAPSPRHASLVMVPKGNTTWIGYSEDAAAVASRLRIAVADSGDGTLARTPGAEQLQRDDSVAAGFTTITGVVLLAAGRKTSSDLKAVAETSTQLASLPSRGASPLVITGTTTTSGPNDKTGPATITLRAQVPRALVGDVTTILLK